MKKMLATKYGVAISNPPFADTPVKVMCAVLMNPSNKENGGIFSHTQSWAVIAEAMRGHGDQAYEYYRAFMPAAQNDIAEIREIEPFAHCQSTHGKHSKKFGASRIPWLSGTVSWSYYTATQWILGIRPELDGLRIDPCIPRKWKGFSVKRSFPGQAARDHHQEPGQEEPRRKGTDPERRAHRRESRPAGPPARRDEDRSRDWVGCSE